MPFNFAVLFGSRNEGHANIKGFTVVLRHLTIQQCMADTNKAVTMAAMLESFPLIIPVLVQNKLRPQVLRSFNDLHNATFSNQTALVLNKIPIESVEIKSNHPK